MAAWSTDSDSQPTACERIRSARAMMEAPVAEEQGYQGWSNYPTWAVNFWMGNDRGLYEMALEITNEEYDAAPNSGAGRGTPGGGRPTRRRSARRVHDGIWTLGEARRFNLADHFREWVEEMQPEALTEANVFTDLMGWALAQVDWHEIADAWLEIVSAEVDS